VPPGHGALTPIASSAIAVESLPEEIPPFLRTPEAAWQIAELGRETSADAAVGYPHVKVRDVEVRKVVPIAELKGRD
jgi:hypothetical protein